MIQLSLSFLGPWQVTLAGEATPAFKYDKVKALLTYLAVEAERPHRRESLLGLFWPEMPEKAARNNLRQALLTLRRAINNQTAVPPFLLTSRNTLQFNLESNYFLDVEKFVELITATERHAHYAPESCHSCARQLQEAVTLYQGPFLAEFPLTDTVAFAEWILLKREWLNQLMLKALLNLAAYHERRGQYQLAQHYTQRQLDIEPWHEDAYRHLMRLHLLNGDRTSALAQYEQCRQVLAEALDVEPDAETTALYEQIRADKPIALNDVALPTKRPHTLPPQPTPFVGREAELQKISDLLAGNECRLLNLVGPGGIGKTRLALQAAAEQLDSFRDGVFFVPLDSLRSPTMLAGAIASALGLDVSPADEPRAQLLAQLRQQEMLILLDNFEHLLASADSAMAVAVLTDIFYQVPEVTLLVTSRERLHLQSEWVFTVPGLPLPTPPFTDLEKFDAVQLFLQSARRARSAFALSPQNETAVAQICQLVAGLPLAIELAAAWVRVLTCQEIVTEIERSVVFLQTTWRDVAERHRSLTAVFDHSYQLLTVTEQTTLRRLALFQGGFCREAAVAVAEASLPLLASLVDKSLLRRTINGRYEMHPMIQQYALEYLANTAEAAAIQEQHAAFYLKLAEQAGPHLIGAEQAAWLARLQEEQDNLRAVLQHALDTGHLEIAGRLAGSIWRFWQTCGYVHEGRDWLGRLLAADKTAQILSPAVSARILQGAGVLAWIQADYDQAVRHFEASLLLFQDLGDQSGVAGLTNNLGVIAMHRGEYEQAIHLMEQSLSLRRQLEDKWGVTVCLNNLGAAAGRQGDNRRAQHYYEGALVLSRELGNQSVEATLLTNLGDVVKLEQDYVSAEALYAASLQLRRQLGDKTGIAYSLLRAGRAALAQSYCAQARRYYEESLVLLYELGDKEHVIYCLEEMACLYASEAAHERSAHLWAAVRSLREALQVPLPPSKLPDYEPYITAVRAYMSLEEWQMAWQKGQQLTLEQAVRLAFPGQE